MEIPIKILQFFLCFTLIVGLHELGHFLTARLFRIRVEKFYIFFDPWFSLFKFRRGETEYGLGWLPLGGYVKIAGMVDESMDKEQLAGPVRRDEFRAKPAWQRFIVMIAGVVMNLATAVAIYAAVSYRAGESYLANDDVELGYAFNESARTLGFRDGDRIRSIGGERIDDYASITTALLLVDGDREAVVERDDTLHTLRIPFERLIEMRRAKGYEHFATPRLPFRIDSVVAPAAAQRRRKSRSNHSAASLRSEQSARVWSTLTCPSRAVSSSSYDDPSSMSGTATPRPATISRGEARPPTGKSSAATTPPTGL